MAKTGTLIEDGLDMRGVVPVQDNFFWRSQGQTHISMIPSCPLWLKPYSRDTFLGEEHPFEVGIIRQFISFSSLIQRMSVITLTMGEDHMDIYTKEAPEKVASLCRPESSDMLQTAISVGRNCGMVGRQESVIVVNAHLPEKDNVARVEWEDLNDQLPQMQIQMWTWNMKLRPITEVPQTVVFGFDCGLAHSLSSGSNHSDGTPNTPLLPDSPSRLFDSRSQGKMYSQVTISDLTLKRHLALDGKSFAVISTYFPKLLPKLCVQGTIFARMSPEQKCQLIEQLQQLSALKAAHAGISLSEAEASVAAPFTSRVNNIECVVTAMRQGLAALVTSFGCFKYMALYSFIQFVTVLILYSKLTNLSDFEYLHIDLVITTTIAILLGNTGAYQLLVRKKAPGSLVKPSNLMSIITQVLLVTLFQLATYLCLASQPFYSQEPANSSDTSSNVTVLGSDEDETKTWESTILFLVSSFMYISVAFTFSTGSPFCKPIYING